ncbi:MAG: peptidase U32 family protein [Bacillota bacterium]
MVLAPELLAPAGNLEKLQTAVLYGADAVYLGGKEYSLRAMADNFSPGEMRQGIAYAHTHGVKVYAAVNIFPRNDDLEDLPAYLEDLAAAGVDGLIVADPGVILLAREKVPHLSVHLSTQSNNLNWASAAFWEQVGVKRIVLARELSLEEIGDIRRRVNVELEVFIHGAMCISYSGRCLLSNYLSGRDANLGECSHPCRWRYYLMEENRPGEYFPIEEDEQGSYILNSRDLCMIEHIPDLVGAGVRSFKIEGRIKSPHYVATVVKAYRQAIDAYVADPAGYTCRREWLLELSKASNRDYTTGFFFHPPGPQDHHYLPGRGLDYEFAGVIREYDAHTGVALVEQRNRMLLGDTLEFFGPKLEPFTQELRYMEDSDGRPISAAPHPQQLIRMPVDHPLEPFSLIRRVLKTEGRPQN